MSEQVGENYARQSHDENAQSSKVSQQPNTPFPEADSEGPLEDFSYLDYVSVIPDFAWFAQWLGHEPGPASEWEEILGYPTRVAIVDRINDQMNFHLDIDADNLSEALEGRKPTVSTRIIVLTYEHPWNFDRKFVESIGKWFRINPRFFYGNFVHGDRIHTITPPTFKRQFTTPWVDTLPSQNISFELRQSRHHERNCNTFSAMVLNPSNSNCPEDKKTGMYTTSLEPLNSQRDQRRVIHFLF